MSKSTTNTRSSRTSPARSVVAFDTLEHRRMFAVIAGTGNNDTFTITQSGSTISVKLGSTTTTYTNQTEIQINAGAGNDKVTANSSVVVPLRLYGGVGNDTFTGGAANDVMYGEDGHDSMKGGRGNDHIDGGAGNDYIDGGDGNDALHGMASADKILGGIGADWIYGGQGSDNIDGQGGNDVIQGNGQPDPVLPVFQPVVTTTTMTFSKTSPPPTTTTSKTATFAGAATVGTASLRFIDDVSIFRYSDDDVIQGGDDNDYIDGQGGNDVLYGGYGSDTIYGGAGNDRLYGGAQNNFLVGGIGDDVLVTIGGGTADRAWGEAGNDSFWMDQTAGTELVMDVVGDHSGWNYHYVPKFEPNVSRPNNVTTVETPDKNLNGPNLRDPLVHAGMGVTYQNFKNQPLFAPNGPTANDVHQGQTGDCYYLAGLSAVANVNPNAIKQAIVDLGDGTYAVRYFWGSNNTVKYYRIDADLPTVNGALFYAKQGVAGSLWAALMQKAFTFQRYFDGGSYELIAQGGLHEPFAALGFRDGLESGDLWNASNSTATMNAIALKLSQGKAVTVASKVAPAAYPFVAQHAYMVAGVTKDPSTGLVTHITLRNPWGFDSDLAAFDSNPSDGYITVTMVQFFNNFREAQWSNVA